MKCLVILSIATIFVGVESYVVPTPRVQLLYPRGFQVSIPDSPGVQLFAFHGNINREMEGIEAGEYSADVLRPRNNRWTYKNPTAPLNPGDTLYFWTMVHVDGVGYQKLFQQFYVPGDCPRIPDDTVSPRRSGIDIRISS
ncbi:gram-negative bacteria-binding protein 3-like [Athalia rosae]|uniref:gram-negative bacteria-binding protein 3-like n=1 Tax=Athalia rosae TaxID=37344 RepID=UPI00203454CC|nr:gram-negative bacteria-binding protein 3-like [Athalia rosae]